MKSISCAPTNYAYRIFLQIQCKSSQLGDEKCFDILSKRRADQNEVLIQIRSVHHKFLRVPKSHDYSV